MVVHIESTPQPEKTIMVVQVEPTETGEDG